MYLRAKIKLIGFDSMGTRGMATVIDIGSHKIFIDPGVSFAPRRYGLPPHPIELERLEKHLEIIHDEMSDADIVIISHYHRDHYLYREGEQEFYRGKILYIKHPEQMINHSQRVRAYILLKKTGVHSIARKIIYSDGNSYVLDDGTRIVFSPPMPHGPDDTKLGWVIMTLIDINGYRILHASDVQGPISEAPLKWILEKRPDILIISGPPTYFEGKKMSREDIEKGLYNLMRIAGNAEGPRTIIVDHHLLRDLDYKDRIIDIIEIAAIRNAEVLTAAEYMGQPVEQLEARRKELWRDNK